MINNIEAEHIIVTALGTFQYFAGHLKAYSSLIEQHLEQEQSAMWDPYSKDVPRPEGSVFDRRWGLEVFYPTTLRESLLVASFSQFESTMNVLCAKIGMAHKCTVALSDLKGSGVNRVRTFLRKVIRLSLPDHVWAPVIFLNTLRNLVVHNNSQVDSKNGEHRKLRKTAEQWPTLEVPEDGRISFRTGFNEKAIDAFVELFDQLRRNNTSYAP